MSGNAVNNDVFGIGTVAGFAITMLTTFATALCSAHTGQALTVNCLLLELAYVLAIFIGVMQNTLTRVDVLLSSMVVNAFNTAGVICLLTSKRSFLATLSAIVVNLTQGALMPLAWVNTDGNVSVFWGFGNSSSQAANDYMGFAVPIVSAVCGVQVILVAQGLSYYRKRHARPAREVFHFGRSSLIRGILFLIPALILLYNVALVVAGTHYNLTLNNATFDTSWAVGQTLSVIGPLAALPSIFMDVRKYQRTKREIRLQQDLLDSPQRTDTGQESQEEKVTERTSE